MTGSRAKAERLPPWHADSWSRLMRAREVQRLPHALLLTGPPGVGKRRLLEELAGSLLCRQPDDRGFACGGCSDCDLLAADTHPDRVTVRPDEGGKSQEIKVAAIRGLAAMAALTAHRRGWKLILIDPAHRMNQSAANALLKTLEEPSPNTLICLVSEQPSRLPATIRSRCQTLRIPVPPEDQAIAWLSLRLASGDPRTLLRLSHGAPLHALALADEQRLSLRDSLFSGFAEVGRGERDPVAEAAVWSKLEPGVLLDWLAGWICDLLRLKAGQREPVLINPDKVEVLTPLAARLSPSAGHRFLSRVWAASAGDLSNLNRLLLYESLLVDWARLTLPARSGGRGSV